MTILELMSSRPARANVEVLVLAAARIDGAPSLLTDGIITEDLDVGALATALSAVGFTGELDEVARVPSGALGPGMTADCVLVVGTGTDPGPGDATALGATRAGTLKRAAGCAARTLSGSGSAAFTRSSAPTPGRGAYPPRRHRRIASSWPPPWRDPRRGMPPLTPLASLP